MIMQRHILMLAAALSPGLCSAQAGTPAGSAPDTRDRSTILAMQGEYQVDFDFTETVVLESGYERRPAKHSGGDEIVIVVEDTPQRIVLQHLLLDVRSGHVTKHWRQDWTWQAASRFEFDADQTWRPHVLPQTETAQAWTQCVYEVSDAPRYCGTGRWQHDGAVSTWTSDATWRPLPRREYTQRKDYNALRVINRHTITPGGWTHEQDNTKVRRHPDGRIDRVLVREQGFNDYRRTTEIDFAPARQYWKATADYWARVRTRWGQRLQSPAGLHLDMPVDGMAMIVPLFEQAERIQRGESVSDADIDAVFQRWARPAASAVGETAAATAGK